MIKNWYTVPETTLECNCKLPIFRQNDVTITVNKYLVYAHGNERSKDRKSGIIFFFLMHYKTSKGNKAKGQWHVSDKS